MDRRRRIHEIATSLLPAVLQSTQDGRGALNASPERSVGRLGPNAALARAAL